MPAYRRRHSVTAHFTDQEYVLLTGAARVAGTSLASLVANCAVKFLHENPTAWDLFMEKAKERKAND